MEEQKQKILNTGLAQYFDDIIICCELGVYKPDKEAFHYLIKKYNIFPQECLYIGDSEKYDIEDAKNADMHAIRIIHNASKSITSKADFICYDFLAIKKILKTHFEI